MFSSRMVPFLSIPQDSFPIMDGGRGRFLDSQNPGLFDLSSAEEGNMANLSLGTEVVLLNGILLVRRRAYERCSFMELGKDNVDGADKGKTT